MDSMNLQAVCDDECPVQKAAEIIEGKWTTVIVRELLTGKKRYSQIQKALTGISPKILSARLRLLEDHGLLTRTVYPTVPPTTEYELTQVGKKLNKLLSEMAAFGQLLKAQQSVLSDNKA